MKVLYVRVSSIDQNTDRQRINEKDYNYIIEDRCSGATSFFDREGGKEISKLINKHVVTSISVITIDRLGRDLKDILNTIEFFSKKSIPINFISQGITTLDSDGNENTIATLMISILAAVAQMERNQIRERQLEGILIAKAKGKFTGRKKGTKEDVLKFLSKPNNKKALEYMKSNTLKMIEISKLTGVHINTLTKIKKLGLSNV